MIVNMINTYVNSSITCLGIISLASTVLDLNHIAKRFKIKGGHKLIMRWYRQWDDTVDSLNPKPKGCRARTMTTQEVKHHILDFVELMNSKRIPVNYKIMYLHVESSLGRKVPLRNIKRYGKEECGINCKRTHELTLHDC